MLIVTENTPGGSVLSDNQHDIYSYGETGARLLAKYKLTDKMTTSLRVSIFDRDYAHGVRSDQRLQGTIGIEYELSEKLSVETYGGYFSNASSVLAKDHSGAIFGLFFRMQFP